MSPWRVAQRRQAEAPVGILEEDRPPIVSALDDFMRLAGEDDTPRARHRLGSWTRAGTVAADVRTVNQRV
jgi:hypothetical protein